ncbi:hypothetical protein ACFWF4_31630, partial [Nocardiopsis flavescens]
MNSSKTPPPGGKVLVYGAYGHTGRFAVAELARRGLEPVLSGRSAERLAGLSRLHPGLEVRPAPDAAALARAVRGPAAVVNTAGPFLETAEPVAGGARAGGGHQQGGGAEQPPPAAGRGGVGAAPAP